MPLPVWKLIITVTPPWHECTKLLLSVAATATFMMVALSWLNFISKDGEKIWYENEEQRVDVNILFHPLPFGLSCPLCQWGELERVPPPGFWQEMLELANHLFWQPQLTSSRAAQGSLYLQLDSAQTAHTVSWHAADKISLYEALSSSLSPSTWWFTWHGPPSRP